MKKILKAVKMFAVITSFLFVIGTNSYGQTWGKITTGFETGEASGGLFTEMTYSLTGHDIVNFGQTLFTGGAWEIITVDGNSKNLRGWNSSEETIAGFKIDTARTINIKNLSFFDFSNIVDEDGKSGGVVYIEGSSIMTFSGTVNFLTNTASFFGGVILSTSGASVVFNNASSRFRDNTAANGGVFASQNMANIMFNSSKMQIINNTASASGGVLFTDDSITKFNNSELDITNNFANVMGGAIYAEKFSTITFSNSIVNFTTNSASDGGAIYADSSSFSFSRSTLDFRYNDASAGSGGAIYLQSSTITISNANTYFINNTALNGAGGAISVKDSDLLFKNSVAVFANNEAENGGAIAVSGNSNIVLENVDFVNNEATVNGGAIYIGGDDAKVIIRATNGNVSFIGNKVGTNPNDIYMDGASELELNVADKSQIIMNGGMTVAATSRVKKTGRGGILLNTTNQSFEGILSIEEGNIKPTANFEITGTLNIGTNGSILINEKIPVEIAADQFTIDGNLNIGFDIEEWTVSGVNADVIYIQLGSTLTVTDFWYGEVGDRIQVMSANSLTGTFDYLVYNEKKISVELDYGTPNAVYLTINWVSPGDVDLTELTELTRNQEEVQTLLNKISVRNAISNDVRFQIANLIDTGRIREAQQALESLNGAFFANLLTVGAINNNFAAMHTRINTINEKQSQEQNPFSQNEGENEHQIWVQGNINGVTYSKETNAANEFKSNKLEIQTGIDVFRDESGLFGVYFGYGNSSLEQGKDSADVVDTEIGFYGGWFGSNLSFIGTLSGGLQKFNTKRDIKIAQFREKPKAEFDTYSLRYTLDLEYLVNMDGYSLVKPFVGVEGGVVFSNKVEENSSDGIANLVVNSDRYVRLTGLLGVKVEGQKNRWSYYGKLYEGYLILGDKPKYTVSFKSSPESGEMEIEGSEEKTLITGLGLGARYAITKNISAYVNSDIRASLNTFGYFFSGGFGYKFGKFYSSKERKEYLEAVREAETELETESVEE